METQVERPHADQRFRFKVHQRRVVAMSKAANSGGFLKFASTLNGLIKWNLDRESSGLIMNFSALKHKKAIKSAIFHALQIWF